MIGYAKRGPQRVGYSAPAPLRCDLSGALVTTDGHARFQEAVLNGNVWIGANLGGTPVTSQAGLSVTTPMLTLFNPVNSPVNLVLWEFQVTNTTVVAGATNWCLAYNLPAITGVFTAPFTTTNAAVTNALLSSNMTTATAIQNQGAWGQCYRICTLAAAPVIFRYSFCQAGASSLTVYSCIDHIDGAVVVPPGIAISVQTLTTAIAGIAAFVWEEVPINS